MKLRPIKSPWKDNPFCYKKIYFTHFKDLLFVELEREWNVVKYDSLNATGVVLCSCVFWFKVEYINPKTI